MAKYRRFDYKSRETAERQLTVFINEGEIQKIRKWVLLKNNIETGGDLFGLWIDKHTAVVQFVLGPGEKCRRTRVSFYQDVEYLEKAGTYLTKNYGLCNIGQWHSHHRLGLPYPSHGDENTVWGNLPNLGLSRYIVFIATIESFQRNLQVNVNCFLFETEDGLQLPVLKGKIKSLGNSSPFRLNALISREMEKDAEPEEVQEKTERTSYCGDMCDGCNVRVGVIITVFIIIVAFIVFYFTYAGGFSA